MSSLNPMFLSDVASSNVRIKNIVSKYDKRQSIGKCYEIPDEETRLLCAKLILEEALETVKALGVSMHLRNTFAVEKGIEDFTLRPDSLVSDLEKIIDGCCDTIYVANGCMVACGVPDVPHMKEVCRANEDKFPNGKAIIDQTSGKYLKPLNWEPPQHKKIQEAAERWGFNMHNMIPKEEGK